MILKSKKMSFEDETRNNISGRHLRLIEQGKSESRFFYKVENHGKLAQIGKSYLEDYKAGVKNFAFTSINYKSSQQRTILGIASYFDHLFDMKILIVSDMLSRGVFDEVVQESSLQKIPVDDSIQTIDVNKFYHHFDLVDFNKVIEGLSETIGKDKLFSAFQNFLSDYDIILWDTPIIETSRNNSKVHFYAAPFYESITFIVSPTISRSKDITLLEKYFSSYGINIKGIIFDSYEESSTTMKRKWWPF